MGEVGVCGISGIESIYPISPAKSELRQLELRQCETCVREMGVKSLDLIFLRNERNDVFPILPISSWAREDWRVPHNHTRCRNANRFTRGICYKADHRTPFPFNSVSVTRGTGPRNVAESEGGFLKRTFVTLVAAAAAKRELLLSHNNGNRGGTFPTGTPSTGIRRLATVGL
ncbi:hypothetical protein K0M31_012176 [Melipona bicolor]|uniref:Uncharacterized protein n=1 Tax=Melipona bicolor TaxID=60889 RepID=A0AA40FKY1_9HYME|nr:hypothetical protein K0M31_012176 [Melipona bicolor]